jgi:hypothetical protein
MRQKYIDFCIGLNVPGLNPSVLGQQYDAINASAENRDTFRELIAGWGTGEGKTAHAGGTQS